MLQYCINRASRGHSESTTDYLQIIHTENRHVVSKRKTKIELGIHTSLNVKSHFTNLRKCDEAALHVVFPNDSYRVCSVDFFRLFTKWKRFLSAENFVNAFPVEHCNLRFVSLYFFDQSLST